jgi:hypothetical protein
MHAGKGRWVERPGRQAAGGQAVRQSPGQAS